MDDKFVKALEAEIAYMDRTKDLSEEEQEKLMKNGLKVLNIKF